jgi:hypothetical protein
MRALALPGDVATGLAPACTGGSAIETWRRKPTLEGSA